MGNIKAKYKLDREFRIKGGVVATAIHISPLARHSTHRLRLPVPVYYH